MLSELRGEGKAHLAVIHNGRRLKRIVQPGEQVAIDEQLLAEQCGEIGQAPGVRALQLKYLISSIAIRAVQICVWTAFSLVPTNVLILSPCLKALKNNSMAQRSL